MNKKQRPQTRVTHNEPIAIVGIGALFPGGDGVRSYWRNIIQGRDMIGPVPASYWMKEDYYSDLPGARDRFYVDRGAFIDPVELDVMASGLTPKDLPSTDISQLLALYVTRHLLDDVQLLDDRELRDRTSVILGATGTTHLISEMSARMGEPVWRRVLTDSGMSEEQVQTLVDRMLALYPEWRETTFPGFLGNVIAGRIANRFDLHGTNCVVDAACASSLSALSMALHELHAGVSDMVITGGVDSLNMPLMFMCFSQTGALSHSKDCRPFSDQADGTMMGEGLGLLALRRLSDAERDGNHIYALIRGCGSSSDGLSKSVYAPRAEGQAIALRRAYQQAGYSPRTVELVEAHGTATVAGDAAEFAGLKEVFAEADAEHQWCALGSVKSQIGHTKGAAGAAGLIKAALALHQKVLPPTIKVERPNPRLDLDNSPFYLNTRVRPWIRAAQQPRRASVSALGFGGSNFHVTLEEYTGGGRKRLRESPVEALVLSAPDRTGLLTVLDEYRQRSQAEGLEYLAWQSQQQPLVTEGVRAVLIAATGQDLRQSMQRAATLLQDPKHQGDFEFVDRTAGIYLSAGSHPGKVAWLFPGQGSQYLGMGDQLACFFGSARQVWDQAADLLSSPPHSLVFPPPVFDSAHQRSQQQTLNDTRHSQPALATTQLATLAVLNQAGVTADAVAGHSFGEIVALHAAGVLDLSSTMLLAQERGRLMADAGKDSQGAMTAVVHDGLDLARLVESVGEGLVIANYNSPRQQVISGPLAAVEKAESLLQTQGARVVRLAVSGANHSPLVAAASQPFADVLAGIKVNRPRIPVVACATARPYPVGAAAIRRNLAGQITQPVRFQQQLEYLHNQGIQTFIEIGADNKLSRLVSECLPTGQYRMIALDHRQENGLVALTHALAHLTIAGVAVRWAELWQEFALPAGSADRVRPTLPRTVRGHNLDRTYPPQGGARPIPEPLFNTTKQPVLEKTMSKEFTNKNTSSPEVTASMENRSIPSAPTQSAISPVPQASLLSAHQLLAQTQMAYQQTMLAFQTSMTQAHLSYLQSIHTLLSGQSGMPLASTPPADANAWSATPPPPLPTLTLPEFAPPPPAVAATMAVAPVQIPVAVAPPAAVRKPMSPPMTSVATSSQDLSDQFLAIVAEKTGYPREVLRLDMEMESGLGIDSIKRVEILAGLQERYPQLEHLDPGQLAALHTLSDVVEAVRMALPPTAGAAGGQAAAPAMSVPRQASTATQDVSSLLLDVVADKTGYPRDVLQLDMEMESGLGIDSIKRVEILAAMQEHLPHLQHLDPGQLASLATLRDVAGALDETQQATTEKKTPQTA